MIFEIVKIKDPSFYWFRFFPAMKFELEVLYSLEGFPGIKLMSAVMLILMKEQNIVNTDTATDPREIY